MNRSGFRLHDSIFFNLIRDLTGNAPGEGGPITFPDSNWLAPIVLPHQPHFSGQPAGVNVFWGCGLFVDKPGNFVAKPMSQCNGREIMTELLGHLRAKAQLGDILKSCICIPCMMPFITSQPLCREFCELPDDVVFTVEYSVRAAQTAMYSLFGLDRVAPPVFKGNHDPSSSSRRLKLCTESMPSLSTMTAETEDTLTRGLNTGVSSFFNQKQIKCWHAE